MRQIVYAIFFWLRRKLAKRRVADGRSTVTVTLRLTVPQRVAFEDMLATWNFLGSAGASRWTAFFADGDGNFKPKATIDGRKPEYTELMTQAEKWNGDEYRMDFDAIAWRLPDA